MTFKHTILRDMYEDDIIVDILQMLGDVIFNCIQPKIGSAVLPLRQLSKSLYEL